MRYLIPVTLALFVGLTACSDVNQPVIGNDPFVRSGTGLDPQMGALFEKVWRSVPVRGDSEIIVGVLALDRTAGSALVAFENRGGADVYEYVLLEDGWTKGRFVEHRPPAMASSLNASDSPAFMDWGGPVADLYGLNDVAIAAMWSPAPWAGYYEARFHTDQGNVFRGSVWQERSSTLKGRQHCAVSVGRSRARHTLRTRTAAVYLTADLFSTIRTMPLTRGSTVRRTLYCSS